MQLVSTQQWGSSSGQEQKIGDMKCTWKCLTGSRSVYIGLYIYLYIYTSISLYQFPISIFKYTTGWPQLRQCVLFVWTSKRIVFNADITGFSMLG
jgi:hypothetical protein